MLHVCLALLVHILVIVIYIGMWWSHSFLAGHMLCMLLQVSL